MRSQSRFSTSSSQRPLQHVLLFVHSVPSCIHLAGSMHVPPTQKCEQQVVALVQAIPCGEHVELPAPPAPPAGDASTLIPAPPPMPAVDPEFDFKTSPTLRSEPHAASHPNVESATARAADANRVRRRDGLRGMFSLGLIDRLPPEWQLATS